MRVCRRRKLQKTMILLLNVTTTQGRHLPCLQDLTWGRKSFFEEAKFEVENLAFVSLCPLFFPYCLIT